MTSEEALAQLGATTELLTDEQRTRLDIVLAGRRVAAGVVVSEDDVGGAHKNRGLEYLARVDD